MISLLLYCYTKQICPKFMKTTTLYLEQYIYSYYVPDCTLFFSIYMYCMPINMTLPLNANKIYIMLLCLGEKSVLPIYHYIDFYDFENCYVSNFSVSYFYFHEYNLLCTEFKTL